MQVVELTTKGTPNEPRSEVYVKYSRRELTVLLTLTFAALAIRFLMLKAKYPITGDGVWYATLARYLTSGDLKHGVSTYWPPLYPVLVGISSLFVGDLEFAGRVVSILSGSLLIIPVYLWTRESYGKSTASVGAALVAVSPSLVLYSTALLTESTYTLLFISAIITGWWALSGGNAISFFLTGLVLGLAYLVRPEAIGYLALITTLALGRGIVLRRKWPMPTYLCIGLLSLGFLVLSFPYLLYLHNRTGRWTISEKLYVSLQTQHDPLKDQWRGLIDGGRTTLADVLWAGNQSYGDQAARSADVQRASKPVVEPTLILRRILIMTKIELGQLPKIILPQFILLSFLGLFRQKWSLARASMEVYLLLFVICTIIGYAASIFNSRYLVPIIPIFISWSSKGLIELARWLKGTLEAIMTIPARRFKGAIICLVLVALMLPMVHSIVTLRSDSGFSPIQISCWIKQNSGTRPVIMATAPWAAFYTGGEHLYIPNEQYSTIIDYAKQKKIDYLIIEENGISLTPKLRFLLDDQSQHPGLELVYKYDGVPNSKVLVFKPA